MWQASQSNHKKSEKLEADLNKLLLAIKKCGWAKAKEDTARLWAEKKTMEGKEDGRSAQCDPKLKAAVGS